MPGIPSTKFQLIRRGFAIKDKKGEVGQSRRLVNGTGIKTKAIVCRQGDRKGRPSYHQKDRPHWQIPYQ
jgi:hypothetical protein